ncbi:hypothetical protein ACIP69_12680 [Streptomyces hygroscopicus]|uniref:hypothetical protein n=1 Tax=Streptomyces hygroscopicus TaxID=1912 RepID=UPI0038022320
MGDARSPSRSSTVSPSRMTSSTVSRTMRLKGCVKEDDDSGGSETHGYLRVGQQSAKGIEALVLAQRGSPGDLHRGDGEGASAAAPLHRPVEVVLGVPGVDVDLAAGREGAVALAEPLQEGCRVLDLLGGEPSDAWCDVTPFGAGP